MRVVFREPEDEMHRALGALQRTLLRHPVASQAAFSSLVAVGKRYAATPEGAEWASRLEGSEVVEKVRMVWEAASLGMFEADPDVILPDALVEALIGMLARGDLEGLLSRWFAQRVSSTVPE